MRVAPRLVVRVVGALAQGKILDDGTWATDIAPPTAQLIVDHEPFAGLFWRARFLAVARDERPGRQRGRRRRIRPVRPLRGLPLLRPPHRHGLGTKPLRQGLRRLRRREQRPRAGARSDPHALGFVLGSLRLGLRLAEAQLDVLPGERVPEPEKHGREAHTLAVLVSGAVARVAEDGVPDRVEVTPDLVVPAGLDRHVERRRVAQGVVRDDPEERAGRLVVDGEVDRPFLPASAPRRSRGPRRDSASRPSLRAGEPRAPRRRSRRGPRGRAPPPRGRGGGRGTRDGRAASPLAAGARRGRRTPSPGRGARPACPRRTSGRRPSRASPRAGGGRGARGRSGSRGRRPASPSPSRAGGGSGSAPTGRRGRPPCASRPSRRPWRDRSPGEDVGGARRVAGDDAVAREKRGRGGSRSRPRTIARRAGEPRLRVFFRGVRCRPRGPPPFPASFPAPRRRGGVGFRLAAPVLVLVASLLAPSADSPRPETRADAVRARFLEHREGAPTEHRTLPGPFTRDGFLWVGTEEGIARFDGVSVHGLRPEEHARAPPQPRSTRSSAGGTGASGSARPRVSPGSWRARPAPSAPARRCPEKAVRCLLEDRDGAVWAGTWGGGLVRLDGGRSRRSSRRRDGLGSDEVSSLHEDPDGTLWIATTGGLSPAHARTAGSSPSPYPARSSTRFRGLCRDRDGNLWVGSDSGTLPNRRPTAPPGASGAADGLPSEKIHTLAVGPGRERLGGDGRRPLPGRGRVGLLLRSTRVRSRGAPAFPLLEDDAGDLWFGTAGGGLHRFADSPFRLLRTARGAPVRRRPHAPRDARRPSLDRDLRRRPRRPGRRVGQDVLSPGRPPRTTPSSGSTRTAGGVVWVATKGGLSAIAGDVVRPGLVPRGLPSGDLYGVTRGRRRDALGGERLPASRGAKGTSFRTLGVEDGLPSVRLRMMTATRDGSIWAGAAGGGLVRVREGKVDGVRTGRGAPAGDLLHAPRGRRRHALGRDPRRRPGPGKERPLPGLHHAATASTTTRSTRSSTTVSGTSG